MWTYQGRHIREGKAWTNADGVQHPSNWGGAWSTSEKTAAGLIWQEDPVPFDNRFFSGPNNPKPLDDVTTVDEGEETIALGLKSQWKAVTKNRAKGLLNPTDWMIIKASEVADYSVDQTTLDYRASVRTASNTIEAAIDAASDHAAFVALFNAADGQTAPIDNWPEEI